MLRKLLSRFATLFPWMFHGENALDVEVLLEILIGAGVWIQKGRERPPLRKRLRKP
jgi:hypothetical protein